MNYYTADLHFGHANILKLDGRPFASVEEMDQTLIDRWNNRVTDQDDVYIIGDLCYRSQHTPDWYLRQLKGKLHLIQGNHDGDLLSDSVAMARLESVDKMLFLRDGGEKVVLCHFPLAEWNGFYRGAWHIYGHLHNANRPASRYMRAQERALNAGCMLNGYQPVTLQELIENNRALRLAESQER
jgi:calcineurin-like phosphoesterase family protein